MLWPSRRASRGFDNVMPRENSCELIRDFVSQSRHWKRFQTATEIESLLSEPFRRPVSRSHIETECRHGSFCDWGCVSAAKRRVVLRQPVTAN